MVTEFRLTHSPTLGHTCNLWKPEVWRKIYTYTVGYPNIQHSGACNIHMVSFLNMSLLQKTHNKLNDITTSTVCNQDTSVSLEAFSSASRDRWIQGYISVIGLVGVDGNTRQNSNSWSVMEPIGCDGESDSSLGKLIFILNCKTRWIEHCPQSPYMWLTGRVETNSCSYPRQCYK